MDTDITPSRPWIEMTIDADSLDMDFTHPLDIEYVRRYCRLACDALRQAFKQCDITVEPELHLSNGGNILISDTPDYWQKTDEEIIDHIYLILERMDLDEINAWYEQREFDEAIRGIRWEG